MHAFLAARRAACGCVLLVTLVSGAYPTVARAQTWNDSTTTALVKRATARRAEQLADTGLVDYQATAHGYVTFLAQLGTGFPTPPKIVKADELELEVYWRAPNLSKQHIVGRRDTLLLPTDIQYHRDHLGIVQNNFPSIIRIGEGDEVADVPHPLSAQGLAEYDFAITDSLPIRFPGGAITVYEVKVRPKDDRKPRVIGALYIDRSGGQVVRMALSFTRAAFLDNALEDLSVVLENRLVGTRFWLPSRQEVEIRRTGEWLDYPIRGIIRGRWEIGQYRFNVNVPPAIFAAGGPEILQMPPQVLRQYPWHGQVLDSLPPDVRAVTDADVSRVQAEARALVRRQALVRAQHTVLSARGLSDVVRYNRVEGLAIGSGIRERFGGGVSGVARARYGIDDRDAKGELALEWEHPSGYAVRLFGLREFRDVGDERERSTAMNSIAAQEFASDYSDPYLVRGGGVTLGASALPFARWRLTVAFEQHDPLGVHARPVQGTFLQPLSVDRDRYIRTALDADRPPGLWLFGTELEAHASFTTESSTRYGLSAYTQARGALRANIERPIGEQRLVLHTIAVAGTQKLEDLVFLGGPVSAPGYDYHTLVAATAMSQRLEWRFPAPFIPFSLGRFGRVPAHGSIAPYIVGTVLGDMPVIISPGGLPPPAVPLRNSISLRRGPGALYPSAGVGYLTPFDLIRLDVARGLRNGIGRWSFSIDVNREFWPIL